MKGWSPRASATPNSAMTCRQRDVQQAEVSCMSWMFAELGAVAAADDAGLAFMGVSEWGKASFADYSSKRLVRSVSL